MDLIQNDDVRNVYDRCKYIVKVWENQFKKDNGRLPSKLDIREADVKVRHAYRKYFKIKTQALEESFKDVEGFSDEESSLGMPPVPDIVVPTPESVTTTESTDDTVWGAHLNRSVELKPTTTIEPMPEQDVNPKQKKPPSRLSTKLFCGSKPSKHNTRKVKSFSFRQKSKSSESNNTKVFYSESSMEVSDSTDSLESALATSNSHFKIAQAEPHNFVQPLTISQCITQKSQNRTMSKIDPAWIDRIHARNQHNFEQNDPCFDSSTSALDAADIIEESDDDDISLASSQLSGLSQQTDNSIIVRQDFSNIFPKGQNSSCSSTGNVSSTYTLSSTTPISQPAVPPTARITTSKSPVNSSVDAHYSSGDRQRFIRAARPKKSLLDVGDGSTDDPFYSSNDSDDPEFSPIPEHKKIRLQIEQAVQSLDNDFDNKTTKRKPQKSKENNKSGTGRRTRQRVAKETAANEDIFELEYSVEPRKAVPLLKKSNPLRNLTGTNDKQGSCEDAGGGAAADDDIRLKKLKKSLKNRSCDENYVRIDMRKKVYVRGKKNMNFAKYKKQQWKMKKKANSLCGPDMDMSGCDGGEIICFLCKKPGHFARRCPNQKTDSLLPLSADDLEQVSNEVTLEEAARMADESGLTIRKPVHDNLKQTEDAINEHPINVMRAENDPQLFDADESNWMGDINLNDFIDPEKTVLPFYDRSMDGVPQEVSDALALFGYTAFRPGQEKAVMRILKGLSTLVTLSTGAGKSLCYQLPAYLYAQRGPCITLVITPLVSLMEDQLAGMPSFLKAACLHSNQTNTQRRKVLDAIGTYEVSILLVSPEAIVAGEKSAGFGSLMRQLPPIAFACIDEAHCMSQWSHNFRPSYLLISRILRHKLGIKTLLGLTATATSSTCASIAMHLNIPDGVDGIVNDQLIPSNLHLSVSRDADRDRALLQLVYRMEPFCSYHSIIIYCTRRDECERIATRLRAAVASQSPTSRYQSKNVTKTGKRKRNSGGSGGGSNKSGGDCTQAEAYHAGLTAARRRKIQSAFMENRLRIVVATVAFGMGINKSDIRAVIHYNLPRNVESYVQEIGRAGRDGAPAHCHLFLDSKGQDECELRRFIHADSVDRHTIRRLLQRIFGAKCDCEMGQCPKHEVSFGIEETVRHLDLPEENISTLLCYLELHSKQYIRLLTNAFTMCKIISYGGSKVLHATAKTCPPLAMALALQKSNKCDSTNSNDSNVFEFNVIQVAATIGWDSGICKYILKNLEWTTVNGKSVRSLISVEFSELGFRMLAPGNLTEDELDLALDNLYDVAFKQEQIAIQQLHTVTRIMSQHAKATVQKAIIISKNEDVQQHSTNQQEEIHSKSISDHLKNEIRDYFDSGHLQPLPTIKDARTPLGISSSTKSWENLSNLEELKSDIRQLLAMYRDNNFNGRAVARIFHGINSPNYPALMWAKCKFWRSHLDTDFHALCALATKQILNLKVS